MKRMILAVALMLALALPVYAGDYNAPQSTVIGSNHMNGNIHDSFNDTTNNVDNSINNTATGGQGGTGIGVGGNSAVIGSGNSSNRNDNKNTNLNANVNDNTNVNKNDNKNTNINANVNDNKNVNKNTQGQAQGQMQGQGQAQSTDINIVNERPFLGAPNIDVPDTQILPGGIRNATTMFPTIKGLKALTTVDAVTGVFKTITSAGLGKIRVDEVVSILLDTIKGVDTTHLRYTVWYLDGAKGTSFNLGGGFSMAGMNGATGLAGTGASGIGMGNTSANPSFIIEFYTVDGWTAVKTEAKNIVSYTSSSVDTSTSGK